jgi:glycosyltransferase involved in cell wall biosynthesis
MRLVVTMPVYEDWESALELCKSIDLAFSEKPSSHLRVIFIDDGSANPCPAEIPVRLEAIERVSVLVLRRNLGHQRAIAVALAYIQQHYRADALAVMDADGEDRPEDIPRMLEILEAAGTSVAILAERGKRLERASFRFFYGIYGMLHRALTGRDIRFGNFSLIPWVHLERLVAYPELWNHYAATILKARLPYTRLRCDRGTRIAGRSHMNFTNLVVHGMSALFANQEVVGTRLLLGTLGVIITLILVSAAVVGVKLFTRLAIPGWTTFTLGLLLVMVAQSLIALFLLVFSVIMNRSQLGFLPIRDYPYFVNHESTLYSR